MGQKGMPTYSDTSPSFSDRCASTLARAQSTASFARWGETKYSFSSSFWACLGVEPASIDRVGSFTGRTPVRAPQGGWVPSRAVPAL